MILQYCTLRVLFIILPAGNATQKRKKKTKPAKRVTTDVSPSLKKINLDFQISSRFGELLLTCALFNRLSCFRWLYDVCWPRSHDIVTEIEMKALVKFSSTFTDYNPTLLLCSQMLITNRACTLVLYLSHRPFPHFSVTLISPAKTHKLVLLCASTSLFRNPGSKLVLHENVTSKDCNASQPQNNESLCIRFATDWQLHATVKNILNKSSAAEGACITVSLQQAPG